MEYYSIFDAILRLAKIRITEHEANQSIVGLSQQILCEYREKE